MKKYTVETNSRKETQELAYKLGVLLNDPLVIIMRGDLGAGKTTFTQGLAKGLDITQNVNSPTFTIFKIYYGRLPLYHMDVYRLKQPEEMYDLGYEEYFYGEGVTVVEWAQIIEPLLPDEYLGMEISVVPEGRELSFVPHGDRYERLIEELTGCDYSKYR
jgi:tRNA threonylcarbamoyladenosine biosynthesis protein TsaE